MQKTRRIYLVNMLIMMPALFSCSACKSVRLYFGDINHTIPSQMDMQTAYNNKKQLYDSIAGLSFQMLDRARSEDRCVKEIQVLGPDVDYGAFGKNELPGDCLYHNADAFLAGDTIYNSLKAKVISYKTKMRIPSFIAIDSTEVVIPFKVVQESLTIDHYVSFIYERNGGSFDGDSVAPNVWTDRKEYVGKK